MTRVADVLGATKKVPKSVVTSDQMGMPHPGFIAVTNTTDALAAILQGESPSPRVLRGPRSIPKVWGVVERATGHVPDLPEHLVECLNKTKEATIIPPTYEALKRYLLA